MTRLILCLSAASFVLCVVLTALVKRLAPRWGFVDKPGGRKIHAQPKPLGGGIAIFWSLALPLVAALAAMPLIGDALAAYGFGIHYIRGAVQQVPLAIGLLAATLLIHLLGLRDDRKAMGPFIKLIAQLAITAGLVIAMEVLSQSTPSLRLRALGHLGVVPSIILTVLWIAAITNAFNFLDNMDGLSAGVAAVCAAAFLVTAMSIGQTFVAATLALLLGALLGFLCFNFSPASIFMGDSGSLTVGFVLGVLTIRTQYLPAGTTLGAGWYAVFAPVIVLAVPLYDLVVVSIIRLSRGKSPFVGDTNHFSHRLVARGMSRRTAVLCLYLITAATSVAAILLPHVTSARAAWLIFGQTILILAVVALLEQHPLNSHSPRTHPSPGTPGEGQGGGLGCEEGRGEGG